MVDWLVVGCELSLALSLLIGWESARRTRITTGNMTRNRAPSKDNSLSFRNELSVVGIRTRFTAKLARVVRGHGCIERA